MLNFLRPKLAVVADEEEPARLVALTSESEPATEPAPVVADDSEIAALKKERDEIAALAAEQSQTLAAYPSSETRRQEIKAAIAALGAQEHQALREWLAGGRIGAKPPPLDEERARLGAQLAEIVDDDFLHEARARVAEQNNQEYARRIHELAGRIEEKIHARIVEHVESAKAEHAAALEAVSLTLAKLGGLQRAIRDLANEHGRAKRPELESAALLLADSLSNRTFVEMRHAPDVAAQASAELTALLAQLRR